MIIALLAAQLAWADALPEPPECPRGARGSVSHSYMYCSAATCSTDADCWGEEACTDSLGLCVVDQEKSCNSGRLANEEPCSFTAHVALSTCKTDSDCAEGTCQVAKRCATPSRAIPAIGVPGGCRLGCGGAEESKATDAAVLGPLLLIMLIFRRRRSR